MKITANWLSLWLRYVCILILPAFSSAIFAAKTKEAPPIILRVNVLIQHQRMEGFGASGCWWPEQTPHWPKGLLSSALDQLFTSAGADLSIYRYNIGAGGGTEITNPSRRGVNVETSPGVYDLSRDSAGMKVLDGVRQRGVKQIVAMSISPPIRLTRNGLASGGNAGGSNLRIGAEPELARYLVDIADLLRKRVGLQRIVLSPINEPQWKWGSDRRIQEGCHYSPEQTAAVMEAVLREVARRKLPIDVQGPELGCWGQESPAYVSALLDNVYIKQRLNLLTVHSYFSARADKSELAQLVHQLAPRLNVAMTEYCLMEPGRHLGMDVALQMAGVIQDDLTLGNVVAWEWWLAVSTDDYADGLLYLNRWNHTLKASKRLYVLGQYSRFIRPGATRVEAISSDSRLQLTAFYSADHLQLATVIINPNPLALPIQFQLIGATARSCRAFVTDPMHSLFELPGERTLNAPAKSVLTIISQVGP